VPLIEPDVAVMVEVPTAEAVAMPLLAMVAPVVADQVADVVRVCVVPSE
jgi:hypothetical protein